MISLITFTLLTAAPSLRAPDEERVERVLSSLSTREKAAQLVMAYPQLGKDTPVEVGGLLFVGAALKSLPKAKERIESSVARAKIPPFVAADMEGGPQNRLKKIASISELPVARDMAKLDDAEVQAWGKKVGRAMKSLGLNMNLAPVLDVAKTGHMERNGRSYSGDEEVVVKKAAAYARGLLEAGVMPIGKHYPGYGDADGDSDHALVTVDWPREKVFGQADVFTRVKDLLGGVMLANVAYAAVDELPAILAPKLVARVHEQPWLAMTDDIAISALAQAVGGTTEDVVVRSFLAGNDVILTTAPPDWDKGVDYIGLLTRTAESSDAAKAQLDESCRRVLRLKDRMGLLDGK